MNYSLRGSGTGRRQWQMVTKKKYRGAENKIMDWKWNKEIDRNLLKGQVLVQACKTGKSKQACQFKPSRLSFMDE